MIFRKRNLRHKEREREKRGEGDDRSRKKKEDCKGEERRVCFSRRNPLLSDLDSAYQVGEILEALSSSCFLSSLPFFSPPRVNFAPSPSLLSNSSSCAFFLSYYVRVEEKLFLPCLSSHEYLVVRAASNFHLP